MSRVAYGLYSYRIVSLAALTAGAAGCNPCMRDRDGDGQVWEAEDGCPGWVDTSTPAELSGDTAQVDSQALDSGGDSGPEDTAPPVEASSSGGRAGSGSDATLQDRLGHPCDADDRVTGALALEGRARLWVKDEPYAQYQSIGAALEDAEPGDVICVDGGEDGTIFAENVSLTEVVHLEAVGDVTVSGDGTGPALTVTSGASGSTIKGFTLTNDDGCNTDGDCRVLMVSSSSPVIQDVLIYAGEASKGAGIYISGGSPSFQDVEVMWAGSEVDPLIFIKKDIGYVDVYHTTLDDMQNVPATSHFFELLAAQKLIMKRSALHTHGRQYTHPLANTAFQATQVNREYLDPGLAVEFELQPLVYEECPLVLIDRNPSATSFTYTTTATNGGAIYVASGSPTFTNLIVTDSAAMTGSALYVAGGTVTVNHGTLLSPDATISGAGITVYVSGGSLTLNNSLVRGNTNTSVMGKASSASITSYYGAFWAEGEVDASLSGITLSSTNRTTLDPWWCTQPSDLSLPSTANQFFTNPDGDRGTADYVGAVSPYQD